MVATVEVAIACSGVQVHNWWGPVMSNLLAEKDNPEIKILRVSHSSSALPDNAKNLEVGGEVVDQKGRLERTDANRSKLSEGFLQGGPDGQAEWLMWIDDDTVPPRGFLSHLLSLRRDFVGGIYFLGGEPYNPVAYIRNDDGLYKAFYNYPHGALVPVDSIGMGCTLIHRSVYERIMEGHELFQRPTGSLLAVPKDSIHTYSDSDTEWGLFEGGSQVIHIEGDIGEYNAYSLVTPLIRPAEDDNRPWPFYAMEYNRTEDHHFCELARNVGIRPYLDTSVVCEHWKLGAISRKDYLEYKDTSGKVVNAEA